MHIEIAQHINGDSYGQKKNIMEGEWPYDSSTKKRSCETILVVSLSLFHIEFTA